MITKRIDIVAVGFLLCVLSYSQTNGYLANKNGKSIEVSFLKHKIEITPDKSVFNVLTIKNITNTFIKCVLNLNIPQGWKLLIQNGQELYLKPDDSISIPIRVSIAKDVQGEIGYTVVANLVDLNGRTLANEFFFIDVPKRNDLRFQLLSRTEYLDQETKAGQFSAKFFNKGNVNEIITFKITTESSIYIPGEENNFFTSSINLLPHKDTTVVFNVYLEEKQDIADKLLHHVQFSAGNLDTSFNSTIWFKNLNNSYKNLISEKDKPLVVSLMLSNLFSQYKPLFTYNAYGNILFKRQRSIYYQWRNFGNDPTLTLMQQSRVFVGYKSKYLDIKAGDITRSIEQSLMGRGVELNLNYKFYGFTGILDRNPLRPIDNFGILNNFALSKNMSISGGFAYKNDNTLFQKQKLGLISTNFRILNRHTLKLQFSLSDSYHHKNNSFHAAGYGLQANYSGQIYKFRINSNTYYGSPDYTGIYRGRIRSIDMIGYPINTTSILNLYYIKDYYKPAIYDTSDIIQQFRYTDYQETELSYNLFLPPKLNIFGGPVFTVQSSNNIFTLPINKNFTVNTTYIKCGVKIKGDNPYSSFSPSFKIGYNWVSEYSDSLKDVREQPTIYKKPFLSFILGANLRNKNWGAFLTYNQGPYNITQYFDYFYGGTNTRIIRILPYYERYLYKDIIKTTLRLNITDELITKTNIYNFTDELYFYFPQDWSLYFFANIAYRSIFSKATENRDKFVTSYFEAGLRKEFNFRQPRLKYYSLEIVYFKDINGNYAQNINEPGVKNVLTSIKRDELYDAQNTKYEYSGEFNDMELLSNQFGKITYDNIPEGLYEIDFKSLNNGNGIYTPKSTHFSINVDKKTVVYIPFFENNKIFGKVTLNRSKLSNLGKIDVSNIKITATDSKGEITSTLSDRDGGFSLYVPSVDKYIVGINNIFYENFDLRQNNFVVQLNGYKQFEVAFVFDEKQRKINFSPTSKEETFVLKEVRRTNLTGTIKDGNTLQPVAAKIDIIDQTNNEVITSMHSDKNTGRFSVSFITGDNYMLVASKENYWHYSERLYLDQVTTIQDLVKDVLLKAITIGSKLELNNLNFAPGKADIPPEAFPEIDRIIQQLKENPTLKVLVAGHADDLETLDNANLSEERAKNVVKYMIQNGFSNVELVGYRNSQPLVSNDTEEGRNKNRRVEIIVIDK